jgi:hypothetical protein
MKFLLTITFLTFFTIANAQDNGFPYGQISYKHFEQKASEQDSSAIAIVLNEFGEAYLSTDGNHNLIFEHHYTIKILKQSGVEEANISIPLCKSEKYYERLLSIKAASYTIENHGIVQSAIDNKSVFTENISKTLDYKKFTIPNVRVGSIIEVHYKLESPFYTRNFRTWVFQSHLPKVASEYWATIPGNYVYNISWKGFLKLQKNENEILKDYFNLGGSYKSDCVRFKFGMRNIPAFIEEDYMTAASNFIASINFELQEVKHFDGRVDKVTTEWKDADAEMKHDANFGGQLKKGKAISQRIESITSGITDSLMKAKKIYDFIKTHYKWNEYYGKYSDVGINKAFETKTGNIADINLSLIAALKSSELDVEPLVLSTRENGLPTTLFPVLSDFNYVVAKLNIGSKVYLLDASDPFLSFGMLPERCLNGKGRVFDEKNPSYWYDLKPTEKYKRVNVLELSLLETGIFTGTFQRHHYGYYAVEKRKQMSSFNTLDEYLEDLRKDLSHITITNYEVIGKDDLDGSLTEKFSVEIEGFSDLGGNNFLLNPFFLGKIERNPFRSNDRLYPVDFGAPLETTMVLNLTYPSSIAIEDTPERAALTLPNSGGKFLFEVIPLENRLTVNYLFAINKTVFNSTEYHYLKELYDRVIQAQHADLVFQKRK